MYFIFFILFFFSISIPCKTVAQVPTFFFKAVNVKKCLSTVLKQPISKKTKAINRSLNRNMPMPIHIFGTVHTLPFSKLPSVVQTAVRNHDVLMDEVHSGKVNGSSLPIEEWKKNGYFCAESESYFHLLEPDKQAWLKKHIGIAYPKISFESQLLDRLTPKGMMALYRFGLHQQGMDVEIAELQKSNCLRCPLDYVTQGYKYRIHSYSHASQIASYHDCLSPNYNFDLATLDVALENDMKCEQNFESNALHSTYLAGTFGNNHSDAYLAKPFIKNRNLSWLGKILEYSYSFESSKILISVGADHLFGEYGVLRLLQKNGYEIKRLYSDGSFKTHLMEVKRYRKSVAVKKRVKKPVKTKQISRNFKSKIYKTKHPSKKAYKNFNEKN